MKKLIYILLLLLSVSYGITATSCEDTETTAQRTAALPTTDVQTTEVQTTVAPTSEEPANALRYELNADGESYSVIRAETRRIAKIVIPKTYNGKPVTAIGKAAFCLYRDLRTVVIPSSVVKIGKSAFRDCSNLADIVIPSSVVEIGRDALRNCASLTDIRYAGSEAEWNVIEKDRT